jgi:hypothetical protein
MLNYHADREKYLIFLSTAEFFFNTGTFKVLRALTLADMLQ